MKKAYDWKRRRFSRELGGPSYACDSRRDSVLRKAFRGDRKAGSPVKWPGAIYRVSIYFFDANSTRRSMSGNGGVWTRCRPPKTMRGCGVSELRLCRISAMPECEKPSKESVRAVLDARRDMGSSRVRGTRGNGCCNTRKNRLERLQ